MSHATIDDEGYYVWFVVLGRVDRYLLQRCWAFTTDEGGIAMFQEWNLESCTAEDWHIMAPQGGRKKK